MHKLVYTDERDLRTYESLPEKDFKEFFMAYFKYNKGDKIDITDFTNPITFALFNSYIPKLDKNEDTYNKKVNANRENGKKGGRPKKSALQEVTSTEFDLPKIEDNVENENKADLSHQIVQDNISTYQEQDIQPESLKIALNEEIEDNNINDNEDMGNLTNIVYDSTTGRFQFTNEQKEKVKRNLIKVAASKQSSKNEQVQELINTDDELRKYYIRYIQTIIAYEEKQTEVTANSKELAKERVRLTLEKYNIDLKEIKDFIDDDIEYHKMLNRYE